MRIFIILMFHVNKCNALQESSWNWTQPVKRTVMTENGSLVTIDHMKFKRIPIYYSLSPFYSQLGDHTKCGCGTQCMEMPKCIIWKFNNVNNRCSLYDYRFQAFPFKSFLFKESLNGVESYEVEVIIIYMFELIDSLGDFNMVFL